MQYFAVQVKTRDEEKFIRLFFTRHPGTDLRVHFPRRRLPVRRSGKMTQILAPVFPGYVFVETELRIPPADYWGLRRTDGFYRFLPYNRSIRALSGNDLEVVLHFIRIGPVAEKSRVYFDEEDHIVVQEGPLKGLEGRIIKVDKRKGRAKIKLDLYDDSFSVDLAFETIQRV